MFMASSTYIKVGNLIFWLRIQFLGSLKSGIPMVCHYYHTKIITTKSIITILKVSRDCAIITWRWVGKPEEGEHRRKLQLERGRLDVKFNIYRVGEGHYFYTLFHSLEMW